MRLPWKYNGAEMAGKVYNQKGEAKRVSGFLVFLSLLLVQ